MSRIGKAPIEVPAGVEVVIAGTSTGGRRVKVKGKNGTLERSIHPEVSVTQENGRVLVSVPEPASKSLRDLRRVRNASKYRGMMRTLINNMVIGVSQGFSKELVMVGVGYRAVMKGKSIQLSLGYSHPIDYVPIEGVSLKVGKQNDITVSGMNKEHVGQVAAEIRGFRLPEPYHGKGVRYKNEVIATKVGKSSGKS